MTDTNAPELDGVNADVEFDTELETDADAGIVVVDQGLDAEPDIDANDDGDSIPVEKWLEEAATMTQEIYRPEIVPSQSPNGLTKVASMSSTTTSAGHEPGPQPPNGKGNLGTAGNQLVNGLDPGADQQRAGSGSEIIGSFRPIASAGPAGAGEMEPGGRDGSVVIGIVQTLPNGRFSRPIPVNSVLGPSTVGRILGLLALVVGLVAIGGGAGYWGARFVPERWTAEAEIIMDAGLDQPDRYLATQQVLVQSSTVLDRAVAELPVDRTYVEDELKVFPIDSGLALGLTFVDQDPDLARSVVDSVLSSFMTEVRASEADTTSVVYRQRLEQLVEQRDMVEQRLAALEKENAEAEAGELPIPYPGDVRRLSTESDQLLAQIVALEESLLNLEIDAIERVDAVIVTEPRVLAEPTWPKPLALAAVGMLAGAVLAVLCLFLLSARRAAAEAALAEGTP